MMRGWWRLTTSSLFLVTFSAGCLAVEYPPDPPAPKDAAACYKVAREYSMLRRNMEKAFDNLGMGRGPHVQSGPCCLQDSGGQRSWCNMFSSHAAAWEAIACTNVAKVAAVDRCLTKVRQALSSKPVEDKLARAGLLSKAMTAIKIRDWVELAQSWKNIGNDPKVLVGTVGAVSKSAVNAAIQDPLIRELVASNLKDIGISVERVEQGFEKTYDDLLQQFPNAADPSLQAMLVPPSPQSPSAPKRSGDRDACLKAVNVKIAACMDTEFKRPGRSDTDFGYIGKCHDRFAGETSACPR